VKTSATVADENSVVNVEDEREGQEAEGEEGAIVSRDEAQQVCQQYFLSDPTSQFTLPLRISFQIIL
jgi:hypothetical protein